MYILSSGDVYPTLIRLAVVRGLLVSASTLVPGLKLGEEMKIRDWEEFSPPLSSTVTMKKSRHLLELNLVAWIEITSLSCQETCQSAKGLHFDLSRTLEFNSDKQHHSSIPLG
jgi:hypothetical protein